MVFFYQERINTGYCGETLSRTAIIEMKAKSIINSFLHLSAEKPAAMQHEGRVVAAVAEASASSSASKQPPKMLWSLLVASKVIFMVAGNR